MSRSIPDRPTNVVALLRDAFVGLNDLVLQRLAATGHEAVRTAHGAVFQFLDDEGSHVSALAERAGVTKQAMADLVRHLEQHGYVVRVPNPADARAKLVLPTDKGREVIAIAQSMVPEVEARIAELIGERRLKQLRQDLETITEGNARTPSPSSAPTRSRPRT